MYLTRNPRVVVKERDARDAGWDLFAEVTQGGLTVGKSFAIEVKARLSLPPGARPVFGGSVYLPPSSLKFTRRERLVAENINFPLCLFFFTMSNDKGYAAWLKAPDLSTPGRRLVSPPDVLKLEPLNSKRVNSLIDEVDRWYSF